MSDSTIRLGLDIGSVSVKGAAIGPDNKVIHSVYKRSFGQPVQTTLDVLKTLYDAVEGKNVTSLGITGTAGETIASLTGGSFINEIVAQAKTIAIMFPHIRTLVEMGGEDSKMLRFVEEGGETVLEDFSMNNLCAAGTGSFLDQQASRMGLDIAEEFGAMALESKHAPRIAGRCSVFAKSDMIHLQQIGTPVYEIIAGLCGAVARSFVSNVGRGKEFTAPVAFFGGVASNAGVVKGLADELSMSPEDIFIPDVSPVTGAIGAAFAAGEHKEEFSFTGFESLENYQAAKSGGAKSAMPALTGEKNDSEYQTAVMPLNGQPEVECYIGVDIGSLSTNVVAIDTDNNVLSRRYIRTKSRPIEAVTKGLLEVGSEVEGRVKVIGVGTTGSGRYMVGDFIGADVVRNEITAQATAAIHFIPDVDTIFEIGGQDSKYISITNGTVVDFEMNKVCAAGTGSFIEEQAEKIGLDIESEFSDKAFSANTPGKFGDRCTVFIESDLVSNQQKGMEKEDLAAGLAYSIVSNYLNRVVAERRIGEKILFQGGVAWNKAVVAAFEAITGKKIVVPPHHDVTGAIGAAIIAKKHREKQGAEAKDSRFIGFDLTKREYRLTTFECKACENVCDVSRVRFEKDAHYYGARCDLFDSKSARKKNKVKAELPDLFAERERMLFGEWLNPKKQLEKSGKTRLGIPRALYTYEHFPFWSTFLTELGFEVVLSSKTNQNVIQDAIEVVKAETCFPVKVIHGHVRDLLKKEVDYLFIPSTMSAGEKDSEFKLSCTCPYVQSIPYILRAAIDNQGVKTLEPVVYFKRGDDFVAKELAKLFKKEFDIPTSSVKKAVKKGRKAQDSFYEAALARGREVSEELKKKNERPTLLISRTYNGCDSGINMDLPRKLKDMGKVALPIDFVDLPESDIFEENRDMYWRSGQRMLAAASLVKSDDKLDAIFMSNFKCGPDSFIDYHMKEILDGKPVLCLEVDEHSADAGAVTRLEAFFDSIENVSTVKFDAKQGKKEEESELACGAPNNVPMSRRKLYMPYMTDHIYTMVGALRAAGYDAEAIPVSDEISLDIGRKLCSGKECLPFTLTTGDIIKVAQRPDFDPERSAFFMPTADGPCRFGQYQQVQKYFLRDLGWDVPLYSPNADSGYKEDDSIQNFDSFRRDAWRGIVVTDILIKLLHATRPYEKQKGEANRVYKELLDEAVAVTEKGSEGLFSFVWKIRDRFKEIEIEKTDRPIIGVVGEIYLRGHAFSNQNLIERIEALGGEVWLATVGEWIFYTTAIQFQKSKKDKKYLDLFKAYMQDKVQRKDERKLYKPFDDSMILGMETPVSEINELTEPYIDASCEGEAILSIGKAIEYARMGISGVINVMPFSCLPGTVVTAISPKVREDLDSIPWLNLDYDGVEDTNSRTRIEAFMFQAEKFQSQKVASPVG